MAEIPATDGVVPTLDGTSSVAPHDREADDGADHEDRRRRPGEYHGSMNDPPGIADTLTGWLNRCGRRLGF